MRKTRDAKGKCRKTRDAKGKRRKKCQHACFIGTWGTELETRVLIVTNHMSFILNDEQNVNADVRGSVLNIINSDRQNIWLEDDGIVEYNLIRTSNPKVLRVEKWGKKVIRYLLYRIDTESSNEASILQHWKQCTMGDLKPTDDDMQWLNSLEPLSIQNSDPLFIVQDYKRWERYMQLTYENVLCI